MCTRLVSKPRYDCVKSLLTICLEHIMSNTDDYTNVLQFLPIHIKTRILKRLTLTANHSNIKNMLQMLVHSQLKQIDFSLNNVDDDLFKIISCCYNLRELILTRTRNDTLTTKGLIDVLPNFKYLLVLQASNCSGITDAVVDVLVDNCPNLSGLDISGCRNITDRFLIKLTKLTKLSALNMCRTNITNDGIIELIEHNGANFKELRISECEKVTDKAINVICEKCTALEVFIFNNCPKVNGQTNINFENENLRKLKQLTWTVYW
ncbi:F-box and leucine-rich repeat protein 7 [Carabus blaptoides fortunei]